MSLSTIEFTALGAAQKIKLSARAGRALEKRFAKPITRILMEDGAHGGYEFQIGFLAAVMNDGAGGADADAEAIIDDLTLEEVARLTDEAFRAAFPKLSARIDEAAAAAGAVPENPPPAA